MSVLVTGAGGIGIKTARSLRDLGRRVVIADVNATSLDEAEQGIISVRCDVTDRKALDAAIATHGVTAIVHTAALLSTAIRKDPPRGVLVNVVGTANVLQAALTAGVKRVVVASSTTVGYTSFASHGPTPIEEDLPLRIVSERPASIYAAAKLAAEHLTLLYRDLYGLDVIVLRYGAVLDTQSSLVTSVPGRLLEVLLSAGARGVPAVIDDPFLVWEGREEFVDARDCAAANVRALDVADPKTRVYNIGTGAWHSFDEVCAAVRRIYPGLTVELRIPIKNGFAGFPHLRPAPSDVRLAERELGFKATLSLAHTIRDLRGSSRLTQRMD